MATMPQNNNHIEIRRYTDEHASQIAAIIECLEEVEVERHVPALHLGEPGNLSEDSTEKLKAIKPYNSSFKYHNEIVPKTRKYLLDYFTKDIDKSGTIRKFVAINGSTVLGFLGYWLPPSGGYDYSGPQLDVVLADPRFDQDTKEKVEKILFTYYYDHAEADWSDNY